MKKSLFSAFLTLFVLFLVASSNNFAQTANNSKVTNLDAQMPLNPKVKTGKLSNGLTYYIMENKIPENRAEIHFLTRAGSVQEDDNQAGLAHFIEHMAFNGTKHFPKDSLVKFLESTGVRFGADLNAYTSFDVTHYNIQIPLDKPGMLEQGMQVLEDWAMGLTLDSSEIEKERGVILEEKRTRTDAGSRLMDKHFPVILSGSKFADRMPIGKEEIIKNAERQTFVDFYNDWYRPDIAAVVIVGDVKPEEVENMVKEHFGQYSYRGKGTPKPIGESVMNGANSANADKEPKVSIAYDKELPYGNIALYIKHQGRDNNTYRSYRESIKEGLFGIMLNMRLQELTREAKPPFLMAQGGIGNFIADARVFNFIVIPNAGELKTGLEKGLAEVFRVDQHGFTPTEFARAKESLLAQYETTYNERDKTEHAAFAREFASFFQGQEGAPGIEVELDLVKEFLPSITIEEVNKMVSEQITTENVVFTVSLPENGPDKPTEKDILDIYNGAANQKYEAYIDDLGDGELMKEKPAPGKVTSTKKLPNFDITEVILSNGARVLLKPTDFKNDEVLFSCWAGGGSSLYPDSDGKLVNYVASAIDNNGLGEFNSTKLGKLLQSKIVRISPYISDYEQGMQGSFTPKDAEIFFQLLNMQFTQPRKDDDAFAAYKAQNVEIIKNRSNDPSNIFMDSISAILGNYNVRRMPVTADEINAYNQDKALNIYKERFADASNFTFVFVGAIKIDEITKMLEQYIASLPATNKKEKGKDMGIKAPAGQVNKIVKAGIEPKSSVRIVVDNDDVKYTSEDILKMNMMREVLAIRLREEIREEKGGTYGVGAYSSMNYFPKVYSRTQILFDCNPERVEELITTAKAVLDEVQTTVSEDNLNKAKEIAKKANEVSVKENNFWLRTIVGFESTNRDIAFMNDYAKKIDAITTADVIAAAKKYLDYKKNFISVVQMPED
jgi:zinc protease